MKTLTEQESTFIRRRSLYIRFWPYVAIPLGIIFLGLVIYLHILEPWQLNPWVMMDKLNSNTIGYTELIEYATAYPILMLCIVVLILFLLIYRFVRNSVERKYLNIINKLKDT